MGAVWRKPIVAVAATAGARRELHRVRRWFHVTYTFGQVDRFAQTNIRSPSTMPVWHPSHGLGRKTMSRVRRYRDRAAECRQLAEIVGSSESQSDYQRLAEQYLVLAESESESARRQHALVVRRAVIRLPTLHRRSPGRYLASSRSQLRRRPCAFNSRIRAASIEAARRL